MALVKPLSWGTLAFVLMLGVFIGVVGFVSGLEFMLEQFADFRYFILALALGFGVQVGLYSFLRQLVGLEGAPRKMVAATGTTSTAAMVSCCAHYLVNVLPVLGVTGFVSFVERGHLDQSGAQKLTLGVVARAEVADVDRPLPPAADLLINKRVVDSSIKSPIPAAWPYG